MPPQLTVVSAGAVIVGNAAGVTVIVLDTVAITRPHGSVAVQVCVTVPPHAGGVAPNIYAFDSPVIQPHTLNPLLQLLVVADGMPPQLTVVSAGAVIVGNAAGVTVIVLDTVEITRPHRSVAVHVCVTVPPHAGGVAPNVDAFD